MIIAPFAPDGNFERPIQAQATDFYQLKIRLGFVQSVRFIFLVFSNIKASLVTIDRFINDKKFPVDVSEDKNGYHCYLVMIISSSIL